jgi:hypothetical protein
VFIAAALPWRFVQGVDLEALTDVSVTFDEAGTGRIRFISALPGLSDMPVFWMQQLSPEFELDGGVAEVYRVIRRAAGMPGARHSAVAPGTDVDVVLRRCRCL